MIYQEGYLIPAQSGPYVDFIAHTPREHVVYLNSDLRTDVLKGTVVAMPKLQELYLFCPRLADRFLQTDLDGPLANKKFIPSLRRLHLTDPFSHENEWTFIIAYLAHQISGDQRISLKILFWGDFVKMC